MSKTSHIRVYDALDALQDRIDFSKDVGWSKVQRSVLERFLKYIIVEYEKVKNHSNEENTILLKHLNKEYKKNIKANKKTKIDCKYKLFFISPKLYNIYQKVFSTIARIIRKIIK